MGAIKLEKIEKWFGDVQVIKGVGLETDDARLSFLSALQDAL